jgi:hypothetical protein
MTAYTAETIGNALARDRFSAALCVLDRCLWPGSECDLLVLTKTLRVIDVEIKISRADLKADRAKNKWFDFPEWGARAKGATKTEREWPRKVWKHYYAVAAPIWRDDLLEHCKPKSGVLVVHLRDNGRLHHITVKRRVTANRDYEPVSMNDVVDIARLASHRMWNAYMRQRPAAEGVANA